jgi:hypothetical protein
MPLTFRHHLTITISPLVIKLDPVLSKQVDAFLAALDPVDTSKLEAAVAENETATETLDAATKQV